MPSGHVEAREGDGEARIGSLLAWSAAAGLVV